MWPRLRLDLSWTDLAFGVRAVCSARRADERARQVEESWSLAGGCVCLSVRSALDLWLSAIALPRGSEVLCSALTIPDMARIIEHHGLVVVAVDVDPDTLAPTRTALERVTTERTRVVLIAHLFGGLSPMGDVVDFARRKRLLVVEDGAQAWAADGWRGHPGTDLTLVSFGTIKTATALGGGLARVRDEEVCRRMRRARDAQPRQGRGEYLGRLARATVLHVLAAPPLFGAFAWMVRKRGKDLDAILQAAVRGFAGERFFERIRRRPSAPLLALLERRLAEPPERVQERVRAGHALAEGLSGHVDRPGCALERSTYWVFPILTSDPSRLVAALRAAGFDATRRSSLVVLDDDATTALRIMQHIVFLPALPERVRMLEVITNLVGSSKAVAQEPL